MDYHESSYRNLLANLPDAWAYYRVVIDAGNRLADFVFLDINPAFTRMTGLSREMVVGKKATALSSVSGDEDTLPREPYHQAIRSPGGFRFCGQVPGVSGCYDITAYADEPGFLAVVFRQDPGGQEPEGRTRSCGLAAPPQDGQSLHEPSALRRAAREPAPGSGELYSILHQVPDVVWAMSWPDMSVLYVSPAAESLYGRPAQDFVANPALWLEMTHPEDRDLSEDLLNRVAVEGAVVRECRIVRPDGSVVWVRDKSTLVCDGNGQPVRIEGIASDVTRQKEAERKLRESEEKYRRIAENISDVVWTADMQLNTTYVTPSIEKLTGEPPEKHIQRSMEEKFPPAYVKLINQVIQEEFYKDKVPGIDKNRTRVIEAEHYRCDGSVVWVAMHVSFVRDEQGNPVGVQGITRDIAGRKKAELLLQEQLRSEKIVAQAASLFVSLPASDTDKGLNSVLEMTGELFHVDCSHVFSFSEDGSTMSLTHEWCREGVESGFKSMQHRRIDLYPWWEQQIKTREYVHVADIDELPPEAAAEREEFRNLRLQSFLNVPLAHKGVVFGFLGFVAVQEKKSWTEEQLTLLKVLAELIANALARSRDEEKIRHLSFYDPLTGLHNRGFLEAAMYRLDTDRQLPLSVILADLNGLKLVNDTYGHEMGDKMLKRAASILQEATRDEDVIARWGGDEFLLLFPQTDEKAAEEICQRVKGLCQQARVGHLPISMALGAATRYNRQQDLSIFVKDAEDSMYRQKLTERRSTKSTVLGALLKTLGEKSFETEEHAWNMQKIALKMGEKLSLSAAESSRLSLMITLHDIGKIKLPEELLNKKTPLTPEEWEQMKEHPETGYRIASSMEDFAHVADDILSHHERWDGQGYPRGLKGEQISLLARVAAIADAYEVMSNGRPYRKALDPGEIVAEFKKAAGNQFDPELVEILLSILREGDE